VGESETIPGATAPSTTQADRSYALVIADGVSRRVTSDPDGPRIVDQVSFAIPAGSMFAITGPSGSGKTTLLNLLAGIDRPSEGSLLFDGAPIIGNSENELARWRARSVGIVFQFFHLIPTLTAGENVLLALELGRQFPRRTWHERATACLAAVGMESFARRMPSDLSGGEQQRVAIARALANDPPLILADEPTGNLDSKNSDLVFSLLEGLIERDKTVVYVTHDRTLAERASAAIDLFDGRIVARRDAPLGER
jgi:putative ABC transport system ATP-binding protein